VKNALASHLGEPLSVSNVSKLFRPENRLQTLQILVDSINLDRIERVCSTLYVTIVTCLAAGLSENAAKFGLGINVSSAISQSIFRVIRPMIPEHQPIIRFFARGVCTSLGVLAAFRLETSLLIWANCLLGAELIVSSVELLISSKDNYDEKSLDTSNTSTLSKIRNSFIWTIAGTGLITQIGPAATDMPFWVKGVLVGPRMFEYGLQVLSLSLKGRSGFAST
jgi:hypothetical protein